MWSAGQAKEPILKDSDHGDSAVALVLGRGGIHRVHACAHVMHACTPHSPRREEPPRDGRLSLVTARTTREETQDYDSAPVRVCICSPMVLVVVNMTGGQVVLKLGCFAGRERPTRVSLGPCWEA